LFNFTILILKKYLLKYLFEIVIICKIKKIIRKIKEKLEKKYQELNNLDHGCFFFVEKTQYLDLIKKKYRFEKTEGPVIEQLTPRPKSGHVPKHLFLFKSF